MIVAGFALYFLAKSWIDVIVLGKKAAGGVERTARGLAAAGFSTSTGAVAALAITGGLLALWMGFSLWFANFVGQVVLADTLGEQPLNDPEIGELLRWPVSSNPVSLYLFWSAVIVVVVAVLAGMNGTSAGPFAGFLMVPCALYGALLAAMGVVTNVQAFFNWRNGKAYAVNLDGDGKLQNPAIVILGAALLLGLFAGAIVVAKAPAWANGIWRSAMPPRPT